MRSLFTVLLATLALTATAQAAWIECGDMGGELVDMPDYAESALVSNGDEVIVVAERDARIEGAMTADEFCEEFGGEVAFVLPIPKPGVDDNLVPEIPDVPGGDAGGVQRPGSQQQQSYSVNVPENPRPDREDVGRPEEGDDEPAPLPAEITVLEGPGPDVEMGCSAGGDPSGALPLALLLVLGLRRREGGVQ